MKLLKLFIYWKDLQNLLFIGKVLRYVKFLYFNSISIEYKNVIFIIFILFIFAYYISSTFCYYMLVIEVVYVKVFPSFHIYFYSTNESLILIIAILFTVYSYSFVIYRVIQEYVMIMKIWFHFGFQLGCSADSNFVA